MTHDPRAFCVFEEGYNIGFNGMICKFFLRYEIRELRIIEACIESMPQIMLQFYYLVKHDTKFDDPLM